MDCQICFISRLYDEIEVFCAGEIIDGLQENDPDEIVAALRRAVQKLSPEDCSLLLEQGIGLTFEAPELASVIEKELAIKTYIIEFEKDKFNEDFELNNDLDDKIGCEQQELAVEFDEKGKYYLYRDNFARENQRTFGTISEAYKYLCQDADGACIFFCDGYGESQKPPTLDWLKKVINSCGKVEVEIGFPDGAKDIWIYQKER